MRTRLIAATALLLFLTAGCGGIPVNDPSSPLGDGVNGLHECIPNPSRITSTDGVNILVNRSKGTVTVEQVSYCGARHLVFVRAVIVPMRYDAIGVAPAWPPPRGYLDQPGIRWNQRVPAVGARIPADPARNGYRNLVIAMRPTAPRATSAGVQVRYRENGHQYILRTDTSNKIISAKSC